MKSLNLFLALVLLTGCEITPDEIKKTSSTVTNELDVITEQAVYQGEVYLKLPRFLSESQP